MLKHRWFHNRMGWTICGMCTVLATAGCSPAREVNATSESHGVPVNSTQSWQRIMAAAQGGEAIGKYMVKMNVDASDSASHAQMSVYGGINPPDRVSVDIVESNNDVQFYQQGAVAYYKDNGRWTQSTPLNEVDVFPTYVHLAQSGLQQAVPMVQLPDVYVYTEYCSVYRAILPASALDTLPILGQRVNQKGLKNIQYTFYVGKTDNLLREVRTQSVADSDVGSIQVNSDTVLFNMGQKTADVQIPLDLVKQLENSGS